MSARANNEPPGAPGRPGVVRGEATASAPGKLYVAGEYAVVEPGHTAILVAVDRYVTVTAEAGAAGGSAPGTGSVSSAAFGAEPRRWRLGDTADPAGSANPADSADLDGSADPAGPAPRVVPDDGHVDYVMSALAVAEALCRDAGIDSAATGLDLRISSTLDEADGRKFGLGSSGAVAVATVDAATRALGLVLTPDELFRSALLATIAVSPNASGGDIATSTYGGWVEYVSPDRAVLRRQLSERGAAWTVRHGDWGSCAVRRLGAPAGLRLHVGWTGAPASTNSLVARVRRQEGDAAAEYARFLEANAAAVARLVAAWAGGPADDLAAEIHAIRGQLARLGKAADTALETPALRALCEAAEELGGAAKLAGAGGGDCGIALLPEHADPAPLRAAWTGAGILPLDLAPAPVEERGEAADRDDQAGRRDQAGHNTTANTRTDRMEVPGR